MKVKKTRSAGGVVINEYDEVIVVSQKGKSWSLPKGHLDNNENELEAAIREIYEESGVKELNFLKLLGSYERYGMSNRLEFKKITFFLFKTSKQDLNPVDIDNPEAIWVHKDKVSKILTNPKDRKFFLSILEEI
ncbi:MAG: NUDIX domain-containing protein [Candidatus Paceibacterota bacterium]|jgi:ADP-ribose pyrophosphatase YjhB (NUDIX family)